MSDTTAISLVKGQKIDLTKGNATLTKLGLGLGWDVNTGNSSAFDLDAFALLLKEGKLYNSANGVVYFNNTASFGVSHSGDNLTGAGDGDDETIMIDFSQVPADVEEIQLCVNIFEANARSQNFGMVRNAFIRAYDANTQQELAKYDLSEDYSMNNCVIFGRVYRHNGEWKFQAMGVGTDGSIADVAENYQ